MIRNSIFRANFSNVIFKNVDLTETYFNHTKFENVKFIKCTLDDKCFKEAEGLDRIEIL